MIEVCAAGVRREANVCEVMSNTILQGGITMRGEMPFISQRQFTQACFSFGREAEQIILRMLPVASRLFRLVFFFGSLQYHVHIRAAKTERAYAR